MRKAAWATTAIVIFGCAQEGGLAEPAVDVAAAAPQAPAADGGTAPPGPCDRSVSASEGVSISDPGACPGTLPRAATCAAEITLCAGISSSAIGVSGNAVSGATSDGRGSLVLTCRRPDVGPPVVNALFVPVRSGFLSKAPLGIDVRPLRDGFVTSEGSSALPPVSYDFLAHDGGYRAAQKGGTLYAGPDGAVIVRAANGQLVAESFTAEGAPKTSAALASFTAPSASLMLGGAMSSTGATLIIWQVYGEAAASARWIAADGTVASAAFPISGWSSSAPATAALAGGAIAIAAEPASGTTSRTWRGVVGPGETAERPAPAWLASRGEFFLLPAAKAMAFGTEIVAPDGRSCGTVDLGAPLIGIGVDGTAFTGRSERTFRIYPQLFR